MSRPKICAVIVNSDLKTIREAEPLADLFEVRIDLIGEGWQDVVKKLGKPWIACNRLPAEGGGWRGSEAGRIEQLMKAAEMGADSIDIEISTQDVESIVKAARKRTRCLLSFHDLEKTPSLEEMKEIVGRQIKAGADLCKVIGTACRPEDNLSVLELIRAFPETKVIAFAMGPLGLMSRVLCTLVGGEFTYASLASGKESAQGQMTVHQMRRIYEIMRT